MTSQVGKTHSISEGDKCHGDNKAGRGAGVLGGWGRVAILNRVAGRALLSKDTKEVSHMDIWEAHSRQWGGTAKALRHVHISAHLTDFHICGYQCSLTQWQAQANAPPHQLQVEPVQLSKLGVTDPKLHHQRQPPPS